VVALAACQQNKPAAEGDKPATTAGENGGAAGAGGETPSNGGETPPNVDGGGAPATGETAAAAPAVIAHEKSKVLGHVAMPNPSGFLAEVKTQLVPADFKSFADENTLKSLASMQAGEAAAVINNLDLSKPMGCALIDYKSHPGVPLVCTMGYKGGAEGLAKDLPASAKQADAGGHVAAFKVDGQDIFVDGLVDATSDQVVISLHTDGFGLAKDYLDKGLVQRAAAGQMQGDLETVAFLADAFEMYAAELEPIIAATQASQNTPLPPTGNPTLDSLAKTFQDAGANNNKESIETFKQMEQLTVYVALEPWGMGLGGTMRPRAGSALETSMKQYGGGKIPQRLLGMAPTGTFLLAGGHAGQPGLDSPVMQQSLTLLSSSWATLTGGDAAKAKEALVAYNTEFRGLFSNDSTYALVDVEGAPFAMALGMGLQEGKTAREAFKTFATTATAEALLGAEATKYFTWTWTVDAGNVDGVAIDRLTLALGPEAKKLYDAASTDGDKQAKAIVDQIFGAPELKIDRVEAAGMVSFLIAPKHEEKFAKLVLDAQKGTGSIAADPGFKALMERSGDDSAVMALNGKGLMDWMRGIDPKIAEQLAAVPAWGNDLSDTAITIRWSADGSGAMELSMSQTLLDQVVALASQGAAALGG
jgi:hypothetical protein